MKNTLKIKIEDEINKNRIWRAKEILQSSIRSLPYDEEMYYEYAKILYMLGDFIESGKYFLLTNTNDNNHKKAIEEFLKRYKEQNYFAHLPRQFKKVPIENYPKNIKNLIIERPQLQRYIKEYKKHHSNINEYEENIIDKFMGFLLAFIFLMIFLIFLLGAGVLIKYLWSII